MKKKRKFYALFCAFAIALLGVPSVQAATFSGAAFNDTGLGFGPGTATSSSGEETAQSAAQQESSASAAQQEQSSSASSRPTAEELAQQQQQQNQLNNLNQQISSLQQQQTALQQQINATKDKKEQAALQKNNIDSQLYSTSQQIQLTNQKISLLQNNIEAASAQIALLEQDIDDQYTQFKSRIRSSYMSPEYSFLEYLFGSESFADFSVRMETVTRISSRDQQVIDQLEVQIEDLHTLQESLAIDKSELEGSTSELESLKSQLNSQSSEAQAYISDIDAMEKAFLADTAALQQQQKTIQAEIDQIYASLESTGEYQGDGTWAWPAPGYSYISSSYGYRFQDTDFHTGMDIAGSGSSIYGARIVACGAGTVVKVQNNGSNGYGLFCIIDHGSGYTTLYAHTSSIIVSVGDVVEKGQTIGYVGNSGWVIPSPSASNPTGGSHLHIEFRINGVHQNPANFLY
ncbi:MAG: peptidoglycan DD-metalloendopeptidase family protein [Oscillospiraceae bacterium]|nr:peptidoglycan DD-metalloendopeptidase family protein [Oscillospiraceae bacterium]